MTRFQIYLLHIFNHLRKKHPAALLTTFSTAPSTDSRQFPERPKNNVGTAAPGCLIAVSQKIAVAPEIRKARLSARPLKNYCFFLNSIKPLYHIA